MLAPNLGPVFPARSFRPQSRPFTPAIIPVPHCLADPPLEMR